jgi:hypothetical protein
MNNTASKIRFKARLLRPATAKGASWDGQRSHWLKVNKKMREGAGAEAGDLLTDSAVAPALSNREDQQL